MPHVLIPYGLASEGHLGRLAHEVWAVLRGAEIRREPRLAVPEVATRLGTSRGMVIHAFEALRERDLVEVMRVGRRWYARTSWPTWLGSERAFDRGLRALLAATERRAA